CPCALGLAVPAVSTAAVSRLFSAGYLVKHTTALERLAEVDHIVFDKTGTLTTPALTGLDRLNDAEQSIAKALAQASHHPLSKALAASLPDVLPATLKDIQEVAGQGVEGMFNGQPVQLGRGEWLDADFAGLGIKVGTVRAVQIEAQDHVREGVVDALNGLKLPCEIITGDAKEPAMRLAEQLSLPVTFQARPEDKLKRLNTLADDGHMVLMVGDGLNDTAALASAHASIAPSSALEASRNAADVVALRETFADLPLVLAVARATRKLSTQNFAIAAVYNMIAVPIALAGFATPLAAALAMSVSSITVLLNSQRMRFVR
ncbi:MAG: HAD-IC family P-type ATPase, partial [Octadecabacter sp.]